MKASLFFIGIVVACTACSDPTNPPPNADADVICPELGVELGKNTPQGFVPFHDGQTIGVLLGFQGFRFIDGAAKLTGIVDATEFAFFRFQVTFQNHSPSVQDLAAPITKNADGTHRAESVQIFFNDIPMAELLDENPRIDAHVKIGECSAKQTLSVRLEDAGSCADLQDPNASGACGDSLDAGLGEAGP